VRNRVELVAKVEADKDAVFSRIPKSHTPTRAANELRRLLLAHYKETGHKPTLERSYALTEGKELKVVNVRAYLHTYDIHKELVSNSKRRVDGLPTALINGMAVNPVTGKRMAMEASDNSGALRAVRRYLTVAEKLIANAAKGDWPGDYL